MVQTPTQDEKTQHLASLKETFRAKMLDAMQAAQDLEMIVDPKQQSTACTTTIEGEEKTPSEVIGRVGEMLLCTVDGFMEAEEEKDMNNRPQKRARC